MPTHSGESRVLHMTVWLVAIGFLTGTTLVLTGAGGGILALPLLLFVTDMDVQAAAPIALMAVAMSAGVASLSGLWAGVVRYRAAALMAVSGWLISPLGVWLAHRVSSALLACAFALLMLRNAWAVWTRSQRDAKWLETRGEKGCACQLSPSTGRLIWSSSCARVLAFTGVMTGFLSGLLGVGGGFIVVPRLLKHSDLPMQSVVATSLMVICLVSLFAVGNSALAHGIEWHIAMPFMSGTIAASLLMRAFISRIPAQWVSRAFACMCVVAAAMLLSRNAGALLN